MKICPDFILLLHQSAREGKGAVGRRKVIFPREARVMGGLDAAEAYPSAPAMNK
jgi:hypothetical protein